MVIVNFIRDKNVGIFARVKRAPRNSDAQEQAGDSEKAESS